jgi:hypothetical protein
MLVKKFTGSIMYTADDVSHVSQSVVLVAELIQQSLRADCQSNCFICGNYEEIICSPKLAVHSNVLMGTSHCFPGTKAAVVFNALSVTK